MRTGPAPQTRAQALTLLLALAPLLLAALDRDSPPYGRGQRAPVYALVGGRVEPVSGARMDTGTLVIRDGLIEAVGAQVTPPPDARVIDVKGLTLTPGLIDGFGGLGLPAPPSPGAGAAPAMGSSPPPASTALSPQSFVLDRVRPSEVGHARDAGVTTALVVPREGVLPGRSALINLGGDTAEEMAVVQPAALHLHMATLRRQYPGSLMGTVALARQSLADAQHYRDEWAAYRKAPRGRKRPRYDAGLEAWQDVIGGRLPLVVTAPRENDIRRAVAIGDEFKVKIVVAGAPQAFRVTDLIKAKDVPLLVSVNFDPPRPATGGSFGGGADEDKERREIEQAQANPAQLHRAGVRFALVSGHAPDFLAGVRKAIEKGLPATDALRAVTLTPAEILGVADRLGSLEAGKIANVTVWSGEPLTRDARPKMVFVDGRLYYPDERPEGGRSGSPEAPAWRIPEGKAPEMSPVPVAPPTAEPTPPPAPSPTASPSPSPGVSPRPSPRPSPIAHPGGLR